MLAGAGTAYTDIRIPPARGRGKTTVREIAGHADLPLDPGLVRRVLADPASWSVHADTDRPMSPVRPGVWATELLLGVGPLGQRIPVEIAVAPTAQGARLQIQGLGRGHGLWAEADCAVGPCPVGARLSYTLRYQPGPLRVALWSKTAVRHWIGEWLQSLSGQYARPSP